MPVSRPILKHNNAAEAITSRVQISCLILVIIFFTGEYDYLGLIVNVLATDGKLVISRG